ncbi:MAG TPA: glycosyltransferase, partial [Bacteroidales bacterium]|nr:glycosyltransferase [Bacteroidales bacterium]
SRNFGHQLAVTCGMDAAKGDALIIIDVDLQDPPELMNDMLAAHYDRENPEEIVICTRSSRDESVLRTLPSHLFYRLMRTLTFRNMPEGGFDYVLISRKVLDTAILHSESNPFWQGQILWSGYQPRILSYRRMKRKSGKSRWTLGKKTKYLIDGVMSYSYFPIRLMTIMGTLIALAGFVYAIIIVIAKMFGNVPFKGWAPIMVLILVLSGIQMLMLGIIGEYLWRTLDQVRKRPHFIIEKVIE